MVEEEVHATTNLKLPVNPQPRLN